MFGFSLKDKENNAENKNDDFLELLEGRLQVLYRIAFSYFKDIEKASDAVQDSVLIAFKNISTLKEKNKFNSWITAILVNKCKETLRRGNKIHFEEYEERVIDFNKVYERKADKSFTDAEDRLYIVGMLEKLDLKYSEVIRLKYLGEYTIAEIAAVLEIPEGTVKSRLNTGIKQLKSLMEVDRNVL